jgi:hypothetical protein
MNFFTSIIDSVKEKTAVMQERKKFLTMVEDQSKPIRRAAYLEQKKIDAINEGKELAKKETEKKMQKRMQPQDYGMGAGMQDPYKFMRSIEDKPTKLVKKKK